jgi:methylenetetrahydrofolate--tRNA-(uracil-5-)-methyltransferase
LYFAGQVTGVEGYVESVSSGFVAGVCAALCAMGKPAAEFPRETLIGALARYVSAERVAASEYGPGFSPMNANFGILPPLADAGRRISKRERRMTLAGRSLSYIRALAENLNELRYL